MLTFSVKNLLGQLPGAKEEYDLEQKITFPKEEDLTLFAPLKAKVILMRLEEGINVSLKNFETTVTLICQRCLEKFPQKIKIKKTDRIFYSEKPTSVEDQLDDFFLIDQKRLALDLTEMVRQEILLNFPLIPLCSKSCKGLCPKCGNNLNQKTCPCSRKTNPSGTYQPFSDLKKLLKNQS